ncbi:unnamed protein product [Trifolium pratense]|uniref:Uncharacterized protein n=1 Tax=Trifolium pratense TaxID=57577 RepID=A0ACB0KXA0_TRIPR|nr:unnamed protein product [Trifolium pratense]
MFFWCGSLPARYSERVRQMLANCSPVEVLCLFAFATCSLQRTCSPAARQMLATANVFARCSPTARQLRFCVCLRSLPARYSERVRQLLARCSLQRTAL